MDLSVSKRFATIERQQVRSQTKAAIVSEPISHGIVFQHVGMFLVWCILLVLCWPLALLALVVYPFVWILLIPLRIVGIAVDGVLGVIRGIVMLPARLLRGPGAV